MAGDRAFRRQPTSSRTLAARFTACSNLLPLHKFVRLDASEDRQYAYLWTEARDGAGKSIPVVTFKVANAAPEGRPSLPYMNIVREAARQRGLPDAYIAFLDDVNTAE